MYLRGRVRFFRRCRDDHPQDCQKFTFACPFYYLWLVSEFTRLTYLCRELSLTINFRKDQTKGKKSNLISFKSVASPYHWSKCPNKQTLNKQIRKSTYSVWKQKITDQKKTHFSRSGSFVFCEKFSVREDFFLEFALFSGRFFPIRTFCVRNFLQRKNEKLHLCVVTATIVWVYYNCPRAWGELFFNLLQ